MRDPAVLFLHLLTTAAQEERTEVRDDAIGEADRFRERLRISSCFRDHGTVTAGTGQPGWLAGTSDANSRRYLRLVSAR